MNVLLCVTGSVAAKLTEKLSNEIQSMGFNIKIAITDCAKFFTNISCDCLFEDFHETNWWESKGKVLHIELVNWADILIVAPLSANSLGKFTNGLCDNLVTNIFRAWPHKKKPVIVAPAMNTEMWDNPITLRQIDVMTRMGCKIVEPQSKMLACGTEGVGAMAEISKILDVLFDEEPLRTFIPIFNCAGLPKNPHPGSFSAIRKFDTHSGVDLYTKEREPVYAMSSGEITSIEPFTGVDCYTPWWLDTECVVIYHHKLGGTYCYGEIEPIEGLKEGDRVVPGTLIGHVIPVLPANKLRTDISGHSTHMLHLEYYKGYYTRCSVSYEDAIKNLNLSDPTEIISNLYTSHNQALQELT